MRTNHACPVQVKDAVPSLVLGAKRVYCIYAEFDAPYLTNIEIAVYGWWAGTKDMVHDPSRTGYDCVVGLRYTGAPLDIMPHLAFGPAGLMGVRFAWLDTSFEEGEFNVFRRSNSEGPDRDDHVADVMVPASKCGSIVAPLSFTDPDTGLTPGARVIYTVVAKPKRLIDNQNANLDAYSSSKRYTVPWLSVLTVTVEADGTKAPVARVAIVLSHMLDKVTVDPTYRGFLSGLTDDAGTYSAQIRVVDVDWFKESQLFRLEPKLVENGVDHVFTPAVLEVAVPHIYGTSGVFVDMTVVAVRGYVRFGGGNAAADPSRDASGHFVDCGDQVLPSYALEQSKGRCYCALPAGQIIKVLRQSGETETYETDDRGYYTFTPMMFETLTVTYEGYESGNAAGHDVHFSLLDDVGDADAKRADVDATAPSITFKAGTDNVWLDFVSSTLREMNIKIGGGFVAESGNSPFITGQGFAVTADYCGYVHEAVALHGVANVKVPPLAFTVTPYTTTRDVSATLETRGDDLGNCEDLDRSEVTAGLRGTGVATPCRVPRPNFDTDHRLPCARVDAESDRVDDYLYSVDHMAQFLDLTEVDSGGLRWTYISPLCLEEVPLEAIKLKDLTKSDAEGVYERNPADQPWSDPQGQESLFLDVPDAVPDPDGNNAFGLPTCMDSTGIFVKDSDHFQLKFKLSERYPGAACAWPWNFDEYKTDALCSLTTAYVSIKPDVATHAIGVRIKDELVESAKTDETDYTYEDASSTHGLEHDVKPSVLNPFTPYTMRLRVDFERPRDGSRLAFDRHAAVLGTIPDAVPRTYAATTDPTLVFAVLRDPPGGGSHASLRQGSSLSTSVSIDGMHAAGQTDGFEDEFHVGASGELNGLTAPMGFGFEIPAWKTRATGQQKGAKVSTFKAPYLRLSFSLRFRAHILGRVIISPQGLVG